MITKREVLAGASALAVAGLSPQIALAGGDPVVIRVPLTFARNGMPLLKLTIGGKGPYTFLLDTGAFACGIRESIAKELGLRRAGNIRTTSVKGLENSYIYQGRDVVVGGGLPVPSMSLVGLANFKMAGVDGLLPASFLTAIHSQLDYEKAEIRYYLNGAEMDLTDFRKVNGFYQADISDGAQKVYIDLFLDGSKMVCLVDTGAGATITASGSFVSYNRLWDKYPVLRQGRSVGANGQAVGTRIVRAENILVGDIRVNTMPVSLIDPKGGDYLDRAGIDGLLGTPFLNKFTIAFTNKNAIYFKPNAAFVHISGTMPELPLPEEVPAGAGVVPFLFGDARKILIPGRIGDKPAIPFTLTTGRAASGITAALAAEQGVPALAEGGFDGSALTFGGVKLPKLRLAEKKADMGPKAVLGLDFLTSMPSQLDFETNLLTFFVDQPPDLTGFTRIGAVREVRDDSGQAKLYVTVKLDGQDTLCRIDSDFQMGIFLTPQTVKARNLWDAFPDSENRTARNDAGRVMKTRFVRMKGLDIAGIVVDPVPVILADPAEIADTEEQKIDAIIGMGIWRRFTSVFERTGEIWLKPNQFIAG